MLTKCHAFTDMCTEKGMCLKVLTRVKRGREYNYDTHKAKLNTHSGEEIARANKNSIFFFLFQFTTMKLVRYNENKEEENHLPSEPSMTRIVKIQTSTLDIYLIITIKIMDRTARKTETTKNII